MDGNMIPEKINEASNWLGEIVTWVWVILLSSWGGAVSYMEKIDKHSLKFDLFYFAKEIFISAFVGVITFLLCDSAGLSWGVTAAMVGVSGHMGTRGLFLLERKYENFIKGDINGNCKTETKD